MNLYAVLLDLIVLFFFFISHILIWLLIEKKQLYEYVSIRVLKSNNIYGCVLMENVILREVQFTLQIKQSKM